MTQMSKARELTLIGIFPRLAGGEERLRFCRAICYMAELFRCKLVKLLSTLGVGGDKVIIL
jgi:hypothetical protein